MNAIHRDMAFSAANRKHRICQWIQTFLRWGGSFTFSQLEFILLECERWAEARAETFNSMEEEIIDKLTFCAQSRIIYHSYNWGNSRRFTDGNLWWKKLFLKVEFKRRNWEVHKLQALLRRNIWSRFRNVLASNLVCAQFVYLTEYRQTRMWLLSTPWKILRSIFDYLFVRVIKLCK